MSSGTRDGSTGPPARGGLDPAVYALSGGPIGPLGQFGPLGPLGPLAVLGPLGPLGPRPGEGVEVAREATLRTVSGEEYREYLSGTSYVIGSTSTRASGLEYREGDDLEDVFGFRHSTPGPVTIVLTQENFRHEFDLVLLDEDDAVVARSSDLPGQVKFVRADLPAGVYRLGVSLADDRNEAIQSADYSVALVL